MKYDYLIVGAGLFGATFAYRAKQAGKKCLVIDKRPHLGGNVYCSPTPIPSPDGRETVINVHKYGAHIFHTSNKQVWEFVNSIVEFNRYTNSPIANYKGKQYNLPFNMNTFYQMWGVLTPEEAKAKIEEQRAEAVAAMKAAGVSEPRNLEEQALMLIGKDIYETLIKGYTEKQWGRKCTELPAFIIKRLPVRFVHDNNYFNDKYQGIPIGGYNKLIDGLLDRTQPCQREAPSQPSPVGREVDGGRIDVLCGIDMPLNVSPNSSRKGDYAYRETADTMNYSLLKKNAQQMRKEPTEAESAFWTYVSGNNLGVKFRRQHVIGDYIVDFVCLEKRLVVEIDGGYHEEIQQKIDDNLRNQYLKNEGFTILRLSNEEVLCDPKAVLNKLQQALWLAEKAPLREGFGEASDKLVYTGALDEYFGYRLGRLDWRTVSFEEEILDTPNYQGNAVMNYTEAEVPYTRIIEHKHFEMFGQEVYDCPKTVISREYSTEYKEGMEPYYTVNDERNNALADQYRQLAAQEKNVIFGGRLAEYKYYDMAPIVEKVLGMEI